MEVDYLASIISTTAIDVLFSFEMGGPTALASIPPSS